MIQTVEKRGKGKIKMEIVAEKKIASFRDLKVWQVGIELTKQIYPLCSRLPKDEIYGLASQMKRAAVSVPSNIAEGHSRSHRAEYRQIGRAHV